MFNSIPSYLRKLKGINSTSSQIDAGIAKANSIQDVSTVIAGLTATSTELNAGVLTDKKNVIKNLYQVNADIGLNKFPREYINYTLNSQLSSDGTISTNAGWNSKVSNFFEVSPSTDYYFTSAYWLNIAEYDENFIFIGSTFRQIKATSFTTASSCKYLRIQTNDEMLANPFMLVEGVSSATSTEFYIPFNLEIKKENLEYVLLENNLKTYSPNIINTEIDFFPNTRFRSTGQLEYNQSFNSSVSHFQYARHLAGKKVTVGSSASIQVAEWTKDKKFIKKTDMYDNTYTIDLNTYYISIQFWGSLSNACMVLSSIKPDAIYDSKNAINGSEIENRVYLEQELAIPSTVYGLQGKQLNVYHNHLLKENNRKDTQVILSIFNWNKDYSRNTWGTVQTGTSLTASLYDRDFVLQDQKTLTLKVGSSTNNTGNIVASILGDSYTSPAMYIKRIKDLVPNFTSVGVCRGQSSLSPMLYSEGRAGWTLKQYFKTIHSPAEWAGFSPFMQPSTTHKYYGCTKAVIATLNDSPNGMYDKFIEIGFNSTTGLKTTPVLNDVMYVYADSAYKTWNGTAWVIITEAELGFAFNFAKYRNVWNITQPNYFMVNLGVNDFSSNHPMRVKSDVWDNYFKSYLDLVIASVKVDNPTIKIGVMIPNGKFGDANVITGKNFIAKKDRAMFEARKLFIANYDNRIAENIYLLDPCSAIDSVNGMGNTTTVVPFEEYTGTPNVLVTDDTIHPNGYGYNAMAIPIAGWIQSTRG